MVEPVRLGVIGCGDIAPVYLRSLRHFPHLECVRLTDQDSGRARALSRQSGVPTSASVDDLLADPDVEVVLNLTPPQAHYAVARRALGAGKHVYNEKPLATTPALAARLLDAARIEGVRLACAPATWMGGTWQACRSLVDAGVLGRPVGADMTFLDSGYESWHPRPRSYYRQGAGPLLDMGPYYVSALVMLFGAVQEVCGSASTMFPVREIKTGPDRGTTFRTRTPDHVASCLRMGNGVVATLTASYATWPGQIEAVRLFGSEATVVLPPANHLGGPIWIQNAGRPGWHRAQVRHGRTGQRRWWGAGVADLADALRAGRPHRASAELGLHILEVLNGVLVAARDGSAQAIHSAPARPDPLPLLNQGEQR
jgi:predicted dehydrogenase